MLQSAFLQDYVGKEWNEARGQDAIGSGPLHRAYEASDGWLFFAARQSDLAGIPALADLAGSEGQDLEADIEERFAKESVDHWVSTLTALGIGAQPCVPEVRRLMDDPWVQAHGLSITRDHENFGPITTNGAVPRLSRTPVRPGRPAPRPGSDAGEILASIGMAGELDRLVRERVVVVEGVVPR